MYPANWNNRQVSWQFIPAPGYTGNLSIGFIQSAQPYWPAVAISHLPNGIHGVQYYANGSWVAATMDSDQGDDYIIGPTSGTGTDGTSYEIQVTDASGNLVNNGEVYSFSLPSGCTDGCSTAYTPVSYTTSTGPTPTPTPSPSPSPSPGAGSCSLSSSVVNSWSGGYQLQLTVTNTGTAALTDWTAAFTFADTAESVSNSWNAAVSQTGTQVTATNENYNGSVSSGGSATFGMVVNGSSSTLSALTCAPT
jgi:Cellulose binding domain